MAEATLGAIASVRKHVIAGQRVKLDFGATHRVTAEAMLLLRAEIDRVRVTMPAGAALSATPPRSARVAQVFAQVGFAAALGLPPGPPPERDDVIHWVAMSGDQLDAAELAAEIERAAPPTGATAAAQRTYAGLTEAVVNSLEHAYIEPRGDGLPHHPTTKWWMLAQLRDGHLAIGVCDLGIGIPRSLPLRHDLGRVRSWLDLAVTALGADHPDSRAIHAAFAVGKSRTGASHRGRGLRDTLRVLEQHGQGMLVIVSNRGVYSHELSGSAAPSVQSITLPRSISGTLTFWRLPLAAS